MVIREKLSNTIMKEGEVIQLIGCELNALKEILNTEYKIHSVFTENSVIFSNFKQTVKIELFYSIKTIQGLYELFYKLNYKYNPEEGTLLDTIQLVTYSNYDVSKYSPYFSGEYLEATDFSFDYNII